MQLEHYIFSFKSFWRIVFFHNFVPHSAKNADIFAQLSLLNWNLERE